jgi:hypothetical protein
VGNVCAPCETDTAGWTGVQGPACGGNRGADRRWRRGWPGWRGIMRKVVRERSSGWSWDVDGTLAMSTGRKGHPSDRQQGLLYQGPASGESETDDAWEVSRNGPGSQSVLALGAACKSGEISYGDDTTAVQARARSNRVCVCDARAWSPRTPARASLPPQRPGSSQRLAARRDSSGSTLSRLHFLSRCAPGSDQHL